MNSILPVRTCVEVRLFKRYNITIDTSISTMPKKPKDNVLVCDEKAARRQKTFLDRLVQSNGKRLVVDLDGQGRANLEALLHKGFGGSQKEVILRALREAAETYGHPKK